MDIHEDIQVVFCIIWKNGIHIVIHQPVLIDYYDCYYYYSNKETDMSILCWLVVQTKEKVRTKKDKTFRWRMKISSFVEKQSVYQTSSDPVMFK